MRDLTRSTAARIAGVGVLAMAVLAILATLATQSVGGGDAAETARAISAGELAFRVGVCVWVVVATLDVVVAMALFVVLRPVNHSLSLLAAWCRVAYAAVLLVADGYLLLALRHLADPHQLMLSLNAFEDTWTVGLVLFGVHLALVGGLAYASGYVPRVLGVLLLMAAAGYLVADFGRILFPAITGTLDALTSVPAAIGELAFAVWLVLRAARLRTAARRPHGSEVPVPTTASS